MAQSEEKEQLALINYIAHAYPGIIAFSDMSGINMPGGMARKWAKMRTVKGVPDILILEARYGYCGLFLEMKRSGLRLRKVRTDEWVSPHIEHQARILKQLSEKGYLAMFAMGFEQAKQLVDAYMAPEDMGTTEQLIILTSEINEENGTH